GVIAAGALVGVLVHRGADQTTTVRPAQPLAAPPAPVAKEPERVTVEVQGLPPAAEVLLDGAPAPGPPIEVARDDRRHLLLIRAKGYEEQTIEFDARQDRVVSFVKAAVAAEPSSRPAARRNKDTDRGSVGGKPARHEKRAPAAGKDVDYGSTDL